MDRASLLRWLMIGAAAILFFWLDPFGSGSESARQPFVADETAAEQRLEAASCKIQGPRFEAELSTQGASLTHMWMTDDKYRVDAEDPSSPQIDLVTTEKERVRPLRTNFRAPAGTDQVPYDDLDWKLTAQDGQRCVFHYEDDTVAIDKTVAATDRPFELSLDVAITNKAEAAKKHRLTIETTDWRFKEKTEGSLGRQAEWMTQTEVYADGEAERILPDAFEPDEFEDEAEQFTGEYWYRVPGDVSWVAVSTSFFSKALFPIEGGSPAGEMYIEHHWNEASFKNKSKDPEMSYVYRSRLNYGVAELAPGASAAYRALTFMGPKERAVLSGVGGEGQDLEASELIDLGFFGPIGKVLIWYLYKLYKLVGTWGWAICLLTITVKLLLFPLSITQIKSSMAMRKLKPEMDELNAKYKDDAAQRAVAMQEMMKKNNVTNPMLGCLPLLLQMPVWFALYRSLQTAVELYHTSFGPFIPDLSAPGKYFIIPAVLGCSSFLQQHLMPMQGDPMQQKMMKYFMPAMFTVFMLFLPAGLGIYFLTNTWLGIGQQLAVERYFKSQEGSPPPSAQVDQEEDEESPDDDVDDSDDRSSKKNKKKQKGSETAVVETA